MAGLVGGTGGYRAVPYPGDVERVEANLHRFDRNLTGGMRVTGEAWGRALAAGLDRGAAGAPSPQASRFVGAAEVDGAGAGTSVVLNADGAGFANNSAVLMATEHGSRLRRFHAPRGGSYWIAPAVRAAEPVAVAASRRTTAALVARCNAGG